MLDGLGNIEIPASEQGENTEAAKSDRKKIHKRRPNRFNKRSGDFKKNKNGQNTDSSAEGGEHKESSEPKPALDKINS
jgi:hypothetical protein